MDSSIVTDSIRDAWGRTRELLFERFDPARWLKFGFVAMLGASVLQGSAGFNGCPPAVPSSGAEQGPGAVLGGREALEAVGNALRWFGDNLANLAVLAIGLLLIWIVVSLAVLYIRSVFRFVFVDCVAAPAEPALGASTRRHAGEGLSLMGWYLAIGLVGLLMVALAVVPLVASGGMLGSGELLPTALGVGGILALLGAGFVAVLGFALLLALTEDLLVPAMYAGGCGVFAGWRLVGRAWRGRFWEVVLFYVLRMLLAIGAGFVAGIVGMVAALLLILPALSLGGLFAAVGAFGASMSGSMVYLAVPAVIVVGLGMAVVSYIANCLMLPVSVFFQAYSLAFIGRLDATLKTF